MASALPVEDDLMQLLPLEDQEFLDRFGEAVRLERYGGGINVVFSDYDLGEFYAPQKVELMIHLPPGYPNMGLDMYWTYPSVRLRSGALPAQCAYHQPFGTVTWQRWSRHPSQGWRAGIDSLRNYYAAVRIDVNKGK
jgi:Prokaryotic E2 family E